MERRLQRLGPGAIYFRGLELAFRQNADLIQVAEIEPQPLWTKGTAAQASPRGSPVELALLADLPQQHKLTHGVGYPVGGSICDQVEHVEEYRRWAHGLGSHWTSEHLSVLDLAGARGTCSCGFLMPPLQTEDAVALAAKNIVRRAEAVGLPFAFETGVNYFAAQPFEMADGEFFSAIAETADCGILLDLNNLWVNEKNGRATIDSVLKKLPLERVWEVHVAGAEFEHGYWLDAHSGALDPDLAAAAGDVIAHLPNLGAVIFEIAPDWFARFGEVAFLREMETINRLWETPRRTTTLARPKPRKADTMAAPQSAEWERWLARRFLPTDDRPLGDDDARFVEPNERALGLYRELIASFRRGAVADTMGNSIRLLLGALGEASVRELFGRYFATTAPLAHPADEALGFCRFVGSEAVAVPGLKDMLTVESAMIEAVADASVIRIEVGNDIDAMLMDIEAGRPPGPTSNCAPTILEIGGGVTPYIRRIDAIT